MAETVKPWLREVYRTLEEFGLRVHRTDVNEFVVWRSTSVGFSVELGRYTMEELACFEQGLRIGRGGH